MNAPTTTTTDRAPAGPVRRYAVTEDRCPGHPAGPHDQLTLEQVLELLPRIPGWHDPRDSRLPGRRLRGALRILEWLSDQEGAGWQQRWAAAGADQDPDWMDRLSQTDPRGEIANHEELCAGLSWLLLARVVHPSYELFHHQSTLLAFGVAPKIISPVLFSRIGCPPTAPPPAQPPAGTRLNPQHLMKVRVVLVKILLHTGKDLEQLTQADLLEFRASGLRIAGKTAYGLNYAWEQLAQVGILAQGSSLRAAVRLGQRSVTELVDHHNIVNQTVRDVLVRYFDERRAGLDYNSLQSLIIMIAGRFWADIEHHHPGIDSLHLPDDVAVAWKQRIRASRITYLQALTSVRAFYLDINEWANTDPSWVPYALPSPVRRSDTAGVNKDRQQTVARMHQRTRERLPQLPVLVEAAERHRREQAKLLAAASAVARGQEFTFSDTTYRRIEGAHEFRGERYHSAHVRVRDLTTGQLQNLTFVEDAAFWTWAVIETLRHTGVRIEELLEITHLALVSRRLPKTGETIPLLQIVPSKTNQERVLLVSPELASVLATIITRLRHQHAGTIRLVSRYDAHERVTGPPLPHLFQRSAAGRPHSVLEPTVISRMLNDTVERAGLRDAAGARLTYTAHDFRRMFATETVNSGLPLHIAARLLGHQNINVTQGYHAIFEEDLILAYRGFLDTRRALRPQIEYREPTDTEWLEFEQHFEMRKLELGTCGRPYKAPCQHEHACIRCPMLRVDLRQHGRLLEIAHNLTDRISEARANGWHGEVDGLQYSLKAAKNKLAGLERTQRQQTDLGMPALAVPSGLPPLPARDDSPGASA